MGLRQLINYFTTITSVSVTVTPQFSENIVTEEFKNHKIIYIRNSNCIVLHKQKQKSLCVNARISL